MPHVPDAAPARTIARIVLHALPFLAVAGGCASGGLEVTNTSGQPVDLTQEVDGGAVRITLAPGSSTTVTAGEVNVGGVVIRAR